MARETETDYFDSVQSIVDDILSDLDVKTQEQFEDKRSDVEERIWQDVDSSAWIIYTSDNLDVLRYTNNKDAYSDHGIELNTSDGFDGIAQQVAFMAMYQDALDTLQDTVNDLPVDDDELQAEENWDAENITSKE